VDFRGVSSYLHSLTLAATGNHRPQNFVFSSNVAVGRFTTRRLSSSIIKVRDVRHGQPVWVASASAASSRRRENTQTRALLVREIRRPAGGDIGRLFADRPAAFRRVIQLPQEVVHARQSVAPSRMS